MHNYKVGDKVVLNCTVEQFEENVLQGGSIYESYFKDGVGIVKDVAEWGIELACYKYSPFYGKILRREFDYIKPYKPVHTHSFNLVNSNENIAPTKPEITPATEQEKMLVTALLSKLRGETVEVYEGVWKELKSNHICLQEEYRKPLPVVKTPLDIPWEVVAPEYKYAAMDEDGEVYFYIEKPTLSEGAWYVDSGNYKSGAVLNISTEGIDCKLSLTERPEDM